MTYEILLLSWTLLIFFHLTHSKSIPTIQETIRHKVECPKWTQRPDIVYTP